MTRGTVKTTWKYSTSSTSAVPASTHARAFQRLTLGTMPIRAGVIGDALVSTPIALFDMAAERGGAARLDRRHDAALGGRQGPPRLSAIRVAVAAEDVRHFERRAIHGAAA